MKVTDVRSAAIFATMAEGVVFQDAEGRIEACNESAERILGLTADQMTGMRSVDSDWRAVHEDGSPFPGDEHPAMVTLRTGKPLTGVIMGLHKPDGSLTWISINSRAVVEAGQTVGVLTTFSDVTAQKNSEFALRISEERWKLATEGARDGVWDRNLETGKVFFSRRWKEILGYEEHEIGDSVAEWGDRLHPDDRVAALAALKAHLSGSTSYYESEYRLRCKDGSWKWVSARGAVVSRRPDGSPIRFVGVQTDITAFKQAEAERLEVQRQYREIFEGALEGIYRASPEGRNLAANPALARILGYDSPEDMLAAITDAARQVWVNPEDRARFVALLEMQGVVRDYECQYRRRDGTPIWVSLNSHKVTAPDGRTLWYEGFIEDITARRRAQDDLLESEEKFRAVFRNTPDALYISEMETGRAVDVNPAFEKLFGYSREEIIGHTSPELNLYAGPGEWESLRARLRAGEIVSGLELRGRKRNGGAVFVSLSASTTMVRGTRCILGVLHDITAERESAERLRLSEERFAAFMANLPAAAFVKDPEGRILFINRYLQKLLGVENWGGQTTPGFIPGASGRRMEEDDHKALANGPIQIKETLTDSTGAQRTFETIKFPIHVDANTILLGGVSIDVTAQERSAAALREALQFNRQVIDSAREGIIVHGPGLHHQVWNKYMEELTGVPAAEALGRHPIEVLPSLANSGLIEALHRGLAGGPPQKVDFPFTLESTGRSGWVSILSGPLRNEAGEIIGVIAMVRDISERKQTENRLRESEEKFETLFHCIPAALALSDLAQDGRYSEVNDAFESVFGHRRAEVLGRNGLETQLWVDAEERARAWAHLQEHARLRNFEFHFRRKDGDIRTGLLSAEVVPIGGHPYAISATVDITHRKREEEELLRLATAIEQAAETVMITDAAGTILYANPAFERTSGYTVAEAVGQNPRILKSGKHDPEFYRGMWSTLTRGDVWRGRIQNRRKDGAVYQEDSTISPVRDKSGRIANYIAVKLDVTYEAELQAQLAQSQKMESLGRLAGGVAHDFNNLLTVINGYSQMALAELREGDPLRKRLEEVHKAGQRAAGLTRQLLAFSRKQILEPRVLNLNRVVTGMEWMLRRLLLEDISLVFSLAVEQPTIKADPHQLEQVVMNLAVNARDAMPNGGKLLIRTQVLATAPDSTSAGPWAVLEVTDNGNGMDEATLAHIFEPFFTTKEMGSGLGLSMVQGIVAQSGGRIEVSSEPGRGSTFRIYLPAVPETAAPVQPPGFAGDLRGAGTILVVEDQEEVRNFTVAALQAYGYHVLQAASAEDAVLLFHQHAGKIGLILTDVMMPKAGGHDLVSRLTAFDPGLKVLYMSGYTDDVIARSGVLAPGTSLLQKPFSAEILARKVREVLDQAPAAAKAAARIVIAEDEVGVRHFLRDVLESGGYRVVEAANGDQALIAVRQGGVDLVITDLVMPDKEGLETIRALRREAPGIRIIAVSGAFGGQFLKIARILGADAAMGKPVSAEPLLAEVARLLRRSQEADSGGPNETPHGS